ncbi:hypothetical protein MSAN_00760900 [Mycena sanguinolenta]|uniref:Uncharacterized protein n=1 Tax=Mycena sanguinolenta TaxID=230812 RepID=A0A8H6Z6J0_9AGAR|nr:hypothetical protein MSAN_00760900 [Mycena sanguinolenta]
MALWDSTTTTTNPLLRMAMQASLTYVGGDRLLKAGRIKDAKALYMRETRNILGAEWKIPGTDGLKLDAYIGLNPFKLINVMGCCVGMAKCFRSEGNIEMALAWCEEISALHRSCYYGSPNPLHGFVFLDWIDFMPDLPPALIQQLLRPLPRLRHLRIPRQLGGSGFAALTPELEAVLDKERMTKLCEMRHPDPQAAPNRAVTVPELQVHGSWKRLQVKTPGGVTEGRENFSSCVWNGQLYVAGGRQTSLGPWYRDMWALDLSKLEKWRRLPDYPVPMEMSGMFLGWNMLVYRDQAIIFTGRPTVDTFDLRSETWSSFQTTYVATPADIEAGVIGGWPYPGMRCADATMKIVDDKLYVFGGHHRTTSMGSNLFMVLDLTTKKWRRLSGTVRVTRHSDYSCPGPRKSASSWVSQDKKRIYLAFGSFDREAAKSHNELHGADEAYGYGDFWSWHVEKEVWRRERMVGNPPCGRTEAACVYNEKLRKTIVFGGYHPSLTTLILTPGREVIFPYSYFADTFIYDMTPSPPTSADSASEPTLSAPKWKQVLTPGFPTYRCQAHLQCDPATGRTYMFGGWTNCQFIPTRSKLMSRSFGDLWELRLDMDGGHFEEVDFEEEARVAKAGPWQRCFACASAGPWKKCGGSCKGRVFFCGNGCLRDGWSEHKKLHQCRKA